MFESRGRASRRWPCSRGVYGLIYVLMRLEDFALLVGAVASFIGLAVAMYLTRNLDWYGGKSVASERPPPARLLTRRIAEARPAP